MIPDYSVVVPVFNSKPSLEELFLRTKDVFASLNIPFEMIFVDDGSTDQSWEDLYRFRNEHPDLVKAIRLSRNFGQHNATVCGFTFAKAGFIITIDDDLQLQPEDIPLLITKQKETQEDVVYGIFDKKKHSAVRNLGSRSVQVSSKYVNGSSGKGSSFRLLTRELAEKIVQHHHNFVYIDEILRWYTHDIAYVKVTHLKRKYDRSGYSGSKLFHLVSNLMIYYTSFPLKAMVYGGFAFSIIFLIVGIWFTIKKIFFDVPLGYTSMIVAIFFSTSLILLGLGTIGEYIRRIYMVQNKKPLFSIKKVLE